MNRNTELCGEWKLYTAENRLCAKFANLITNEEELKKRGVKCIKAKVPGNFELDFERAGIIGDPFYGLNPIKIQELENLHLWYAREFNFNSQPTGREYLRFEGIDTFADIYLNGNIIGSCDNMLTAHEFKATGLKNGENKLLVYISPTVIKARNADYDIDCCTHLLYNGGSLAVRKAAHSFGWDIMPRFISGGIWRKVYLFEKKADRIDEIFLHTVAVSEKKAEMFGFFKTTLSGDFNGDYSLKIIGECEDDLFEYDLKRLWHNKGEFEFEIKNPLLWWPRDMGKQPLYRVKAELIYKGETVDTYSFCFGIRTVKLERSESLDENGNGEFCFFVNGKRVFIRGTNWVAMDAFHSRDAARLEKALELLWDVGCNAVRCWGGNVYEDSEFFDFCDRNGILVWQDFAMGCATYPQDGDFCLKLKAEAEFIVKKLRQHPSLALWAGDNECDVAAAFWKKYRKKPSENRLTRNILPEVIARLDPWRDYLPSSPYVSDEVFALQDENRLPENHLWGPRDYFKGDFYTGSMAKFASEMGYHGCPSPKSLKKFISPQNLWPFNNDEWLIHGTEMQLEDTAPYAFRNKLMYNQIKVLFGTAPETLEEFALASQLSQGEAMKFFIERFRSEKWGKTGIIWWNLIDGWPQISDALVDYYYTKKAGYHFIKRSQQPICLMLKEEDCGKHRLVAANEHLEKKEIAYTVKDISNGEATVLSGNSKLSENSLTDLGFIPFDGEKTHFYLIEWETDGRNQYNHYVSGKPPYSLKQYIGWLKTSGLFETEGF